MDLFQQPPVPLELISSFKQHSNYEGRPRFVRQSFRGWDKVSTPQKTFTQDRERQTLGRSLESTFFAFLSLLPVNPVPCAR